MSPVPIFLLLVVVRLREFVVWSMVLGKEAVPGLILVVIPAVVVLCLGNLWGTLLGTATDDQRSRRCKNDCKKNGTKVALRAVHYEFLVLSVSQKNFRCDTRNRLCTARKCSTRRQRGGKKYCDAVRI